MQTFFITMHLANGEVVKSHYATDFEGMQKKCKEIHTYAQLVDRFFRSDSGHRLVRYTVEESNDGVKYATFNGVKSE